MLFYKLIGLFIVYLYIFFIEKTQNKCLNFLSFQMNKKEFPLQFLLADRINPCDKVYEVYIWIN